MRRLLAIALVLAVVLAAAGCGSGSKHKKTIPRADAQALLTELDQVSSNFDSQACSGARSKIGELETKANALPASVNPTVKRNIVDGLARLDTLVQRDCHRATTETTPTETTTTPTETKTTETKTETTPTETKTTPTQTNTIPTVTTPGGTTVPGNGTGGTSTGASAGGKKGRK